MASPEEQVAIVFRKFDSKGTGAISREQFVRTLETLDPIGGRGDAEVVLRASGTCSHGRVAYEAFCKWLWHPYHTGRKSKEKVASCLRQHFVLRTKEESEALGVSAAHLRDDFLAEVQACCLSGIDADYREINRTMLHGPKGKGCGFVCPRDGFAHCSYVDTLPATDASQATIMLSYCWQCSATTIVNSLLRWCRQSGRDPACVFVWQDALCCNQYRVEARKALGEWETHGTFQEVFERRVRSAGHILAVLAPWREPLYASRMWCVFEMYTAMSSENCSLDMVMPEEEEASFVAALGSDGLRHFWLRESRITVQRTKVSCAIDRANILRCVDPDATDYGNSAKCAELNEKVTLQLRRWFADVAEKHAQAHLNTPTCAGRLPLAATATKRHTATSTAATQLGSAAQLLIDGGDAGKAQRLLEAGLQQHPGHAGLLASYGVCMERQRRVKEAMQAYHEAKVAFEAVGGSASPAYAAVLKSIGVLCDAQGRNSQAALLYKQARVILEAAGATATVEYASLLRILGARLATQGRGDESMGLYRRAKAAYEAADATDVQSYAALLVMMGSRHGKEGRDEEALDMFGQAKAALETMAHMMHPNYGDVLLNMGACHLRKGRLSEALPYYAEAKEVYEVARARERPQYAQTLDGLRRCANE